MPDLGFFDAVQEVWSFLFGFFPDWFQAIIIVALGTFVVVLGLKLAKFLKDLFWPF